MNLQISDEYYGPSISVTFPTTEEHIWQKITELRNRGGPNQDMLFIRGDGIVWHFEDALRPTDLTTADGIRKLNRLADVVDTMDIPTKKVFAGALRVENAASLDDVLRTASCLNQYEIIEDVTSDKELGVWLVEHELASAEFSEEVRPYLNYSEIGAKYCASHSGVYTENGCVLRREMAQEQAMAEDSRSIFPHQGQDQMML